jgi:hypothetical protein
MLDILSLPIFYWGGGQIDISSLPKAVRIIFPHFCILNSKPQCLFCVQYTFCSPEVESLLEAVLTVEDEEAICVCTCVHILAVDIWKKFLFVRLLWKVPLLHCDQGLLLWTEKEREIERERKRYHCRFGLTRAKT